MKNRNENETNKKLLITCPPGCGTSLAKELTNYGYQTFDSFNQGTYTQTDTKGLMHINLYSRIASKVYCQIGQQNNTKNFDKLFDYTKNIPRKDYIAQGYGISIEVMTSDSKLHAKRTIQAVSHKAISTSLTGSRDKKRIVHDEKEVIQVRCILRNNTLSRYINTSGVALHERGYRKKAGEAPLKENLAATLILLSHKKGSEQKDKTSKQKIYDPCCGSGTIAIEAALMQTGLPPSRDEHKSTRYFSFQNFNNHDQKQREELIQEIPKIERKKETEEEKMPENKKSEEFPKKIFASDVDNYVLDRAKANAKRAGVDHLIHFFQHDITQGLPAELTREEEQEEEKTNSLHIITNPPYGQRLRPEQIRKIHQKLINTENKTTLITAYKPAESMIRAKTSKYKKIKTKNGPNECNIFLIK